MEGNRVIFTPKQAAATISAVGEPDILRHITVLPGVAQGLEGTLGLFVRGSDNTANLIEFNGVPMNSSAHLLGLFSSFPTEMVQETEFSTGGIDVRQGDMASSVVRITPKRALDQQQGGHVSVSPYLVGVSWQRHVSEKTGYSVAIRQSLLPQVGRFLLSAHTETEGTGLSGYLGDGLILTDWKPSDRDRADLMAYWSVDTYQISPESASVRFTTDMLALKAGWQRKLSSNRTWYAKAYLSRAHSGHRQKNKGHTLELTNTRTDASLEGLVEWRSSSGDTYTLGGNYTASFFHPADRGTEPCHLVSAFADWKRRTDTWNWMFGIRSSLALTGNGISPGIDLRAKVDYRLNVHWTLEATFDRLTQYHHTLEGLPTGWNVNIMIPASSDFPAEVTNQGYCGISYRGNLGPFQFQALSGAFLRGMSGLVCYQTTSNLLFVKNASWEESTDIGKGRSYGLETFAMLTGRRLEASVAYTLSKAERKRSGNSRLSIMGRPSPSSMTGAISLTRNSSCLCGKSRANVAINANNISPPPSPGIPERPSPCPFPSIRERTFHIGPEGRADGIYRIRPLSCRIPVLKCRRKTASACPTICDGISPGTGRSTVPRPCTS